MLAWLLSPLGRWIAAAGAALTAIMGIYAKGRRDAARAAEIQALRRERDAKEAADAEAARYRSDGAAQRLRDGKF